MILMAIIGLTAFSLLEMAKLLKSQKKKELIVFAILSGLNLILGISLSFGLKIMTPHDLLKAAITLIPWHIWR